MTQSAPNDSVCNDSASCGAAAAESPEVWRTLMAVYLGAILFLSLALNGTLCLMFYRKPYLLNISNCFVLNLICCQLCLSLLVLPFSLFAAVSQDWIYTGHWCNAQGFFFTIVVVTQQLALLTISVDRNYAIMNSLRYPTVFNQTLCTILIAFSWTFAVIISVPPLLQSGVGRYSFHKGQFVCALDWNSNLSFLVVFCVITFLLPIVIQSFCYIKIFLAALGHSKRSSKVCPMTSVQSRTTTDFRSDSSTGESGDYTEEIRRSSVECKAVKTILVIALAYSICWVPFFIDAFLTMKGKTVDPNFSAAAVCFLFSSSIINPMIYAFMNRVTRREIGRFICGNSGLTDSDEAASTSMSAYSTAWIQNKLRSRSNGEANNEMETIFEETEVDSNVFYETCSESRLNLTIKSPDTRSMNHRGEIVVKSKAPVRFKEDELTVLPNAVLNIPEIVLPNETEGTEESVSHNKRQKKDSAWKIVKTEKFNEERRKSAKSKGDSYFDKGRRRRKRDGGSFLFFENSPSVGENSKGFKLKHERKINQRYSVDHVQSISLGKYPSTMKFRLSLNEAGLKNVNKVRIKSDIKFENRAFSDDGDESPVESFTSLSRSPRHTYTDITPSCSAVCDSRHQSSSKLPQQLSLQALNALSAPVSPQLEMVNEFRKPITEYMSSKPRHKSAPSVLSSQNKDTDRSAGTYDLKDGVLSETLVLNEMPSNKDRRELKTL